MSKFTVIIDTKSIDAKHYRPKFGKDDEAYFHSFSDPNGEVVSPSLIMSARNERGLMGWNKSDFDNMTEQEKKDFLDFLFETGHVKVILNASVSGCQHLEEPIIERLWKIMRIKISQNPPPRKE